MKVCIQVGCVPPEMLPISPSMHCLCVGGGVCPEGKCPGWCLPRGCTRLPREGGVCLGICVADPPVIRMTDRCRNITLLKPVSNQILCRELKSPEHTLPGLQGIRFYIQIPASGGLGVSWRNPEKPFVESMEEHDPKELWCLYSNGGKPF